MLGFSLDSRMSLSAYADDITVFVNHAEDVYSVYLRYSVFMRKIHQLK